jgi:hypothetical protein
MGLDKNKHENEASNNVFRLSSVVRENHFLACHSIGIEEFLLETFSREALTFCMEWSPLFR